MIYRPNNTKNLESRKAIKATSRVFLWAFFLACTIFWWLPSFFYRILLNVKDPVDNKILTISLFAWLAFLVGFWLMRPRAKKISTKLNYQLTAVAWFSQKATLALTAPSIALAIAFFFYRANVDYGAGEGISGIYQATLYAHLFFGFLYLGTVSEKERFSNILIIVLLLVIPRLIISLSWGRFFLGQALIPIVLIFISRGWIKLNIKHAWLLVLICLFIIFVPSIVRGDFMQNKNDMYRFFVNGSTLRLFQDNLNLNLSQRCSPLFISLTAKIIPYSQLHVCTIDIWGMKGLPATLDRLLAFDEIGYSDALVGPGSNYILELYLVGGIAAIISGSILLGLSCKWFVWSLMTRSAYVGIWAECLTRALFSPRSNFGYIFERIPSLLLTTAIVTYIATVLYSKITRRQKVRNKMI